MIRRLIKAEKGIAMPLVVFLVAIMILLGFTAAFLVDSQRTMGMRYSGTEKGLHFAEAGINKYIWHLNKDSNYYKKTSFTEDEAAPEVTTAYQNGFYYLEVDEPTTEVPMVTIRATGWPDRDASAMTTVEVQVHKRQFVQFIYVTNQEITPDGSEVWWFTGDETFGKVHTNGRLNIYGDPIFHNEVTYSGQDPQIASGSNPSFPEGYPHRDTELAFPASNSQLKRQAMLNGYYFNGRTSIFLQGNTMKVRRWDTDNGAWIIENNKPLPPNGVIYVDGTMANVSGPTTKYNRQAGNVFISGELDGRLTIAAANDIYITHRDPTNATYSSATQASGLRYSNTNFTGENLSDDMLGMVAGRYVRILHKNWPSYTTTGNAYVSHSNVAPQNITLHAAIFALDWAFEFEDFRDNAPRGTITLVGSLIQNYRGGVGTFYWGGGQASGYLKDYNHDPRMAYDSPPHFLEPTNSGWEIQSWQLVSHPEALTQ